MTWRDHIMVDPAICYGKPNIKETRAMVSVVLDNIEAGDLSKNLTHRTLGRWPSIPMLRFSRRNQPAKRKQTLFSTGRTCSRCDWSLIQSCLAETCLGRVVDRVHGIVTLDHGPLVEVRPTFWVEGVWNGSFQRGDFGTTECMYGTGGIVAEDSVRFVTSASTLDYLFYAESGDHVTVSNSLPLLLASISDALDPHCRKYHLICNSICRGIEEYERTIPTQLGQVKRVVYWNLDVSSKAISESDKRELPHFTSFKEYRDYLRDNYGLIAANARDSARTTPLEIWSTQSKGYDTTAVNALCSPYGIDQVVTISQAKAPTHLAHQDAGVQHENDDGSEICALFGLPCTRTMMGVRFVPSSVFPVFDRIDAHSSRSTTMSRCIIA